MGIASLPDAPTARGKRTRARILGVATELFARHGYAAVTMRQLGEAAGLDNSSLYRHFPDKRSLAAAALDSAADELLERVRPLADPADDLFERMIAVTLDISDHLAERPAVARLLLDWILVPDHDDDVLPGVSTDEVDRPSVQFLTIFGDSIARARRAGSIRRVEVLETLVNIIAVVLLRPATAGSWLASEDRKRAPATRRRARRREVEAFLRGALAPAPPRAAER